MRKLKKEKGFTLIELIMVMVILAVLGSVALPQYVDLRAEARLAAEQGVAGGVRAGIVTFFVDPARGNRTSYPTTLDSVANNTACAQATPCYGTVLQQGGITNDWTKLTATTYRSSVNGTNVWTYTPGTGAFNKTVN